MTMEYEVAVTLDIAFAERGGEALLADLYRPAGRERAPTLVAYGTDSQRERFLPPMAAGAGIDYTLRIGPLPVRWRARSRSGARHGRRAS